MADPTEPTVPNTSAAPATPPVDAGAPAPTPTENRTYTAEEMREANGEAARWRKTLREEQAAKAELEKKLQDIENAKMAEEGRWKDLAEAAQKEALNARQELMTRVTRAEIRSAAAAAGILDVEIADLIKIPEGFTGEFADLVEQHKAAKPSLYKSAQVAAPIAAPAPAPSQSAAPTPIPVARDSTQPDVKDMSKKEYEAYKKSFLTKMRARY